MLYVRGHARDYDHWRQIGLSGWGYADVLPAISGGARACMMSMAPMSGMALADRSMSPRRRRATISAARGVCQQAAARGRLSGDARFQRSRQQEGCRHVSSDGEGWAALLGGRGLSRADRRRAAKSERAHQRQRHAHHHRARRRGGRGICGGAGQAGEACLCEARSAEAPARFNRRTCCCSQALALRIS